MDFNNSIITIQESKSGKKRMLPMDDTVCETLKVLPSRFKKGYVFPSPVGEGKPLYDCRKQFSNAVKQAGIGNFRFHDLRHTFASHLVMSGVDPMTGKELLGHTTLTMTIRYSHLAPDHRMRAIQTLDSAYPTDTITDTVENSGIDPLAQVVENISGDVAQLGRAPESHSGGRGFESLRLHQLNPFDSITLSRY